MRSLRSLIPLLFLAVAAANLRAQASLAPPDFALHPAFTLSVFAAEPDVVDPVALAFDADGRLYVVEMRDYPYGLDENAKAGGRIRLLEDTNADGRADRSLVFADNLSFPTSVAPWKDGVIVTAPPEILLLRDTDGDGRADEREVLYSGFQLGVTDSNVNGLRWGPDNRLHGVNGGNGGQIKSHRKPGPAISIQRMDFKFEPGTGAFETTFHTSGGFGLVFNEWGDSFVTYNIDHIQQRIIPARYLNRHPGLPPIRATESISDHEVMARIYPISVPETRPNHPEQSGHFSSAGGLGYLDSSYPGDLAGSVLVCDVVGNLVHCDVLVPDGPIFIARRAPTETQTEFFASRDSHCRPVGVETGPDGALYLIDMQRDVIEHPDYIPEKLRRRLDIRAGADRGRIYRLTLTNQASVAPDSLSRRTSQELVPLLADPNPWRRQTAQRLLVERQDQTVASSLADILESHPNPLARFHALGSLAGLNRAGPQEILLGLRDSHPGMRRAAIMLSENGPLTPTLLKALHRLAEDSDGQVRFQAALALGHSADADTLKALGAILKRDSPHRWARLAVYSSLQPGQEMTLLDQWLKSGQSPTNISFLQVVEELADLTGARASPALGTILAGVEQQPESVLLAALRGLATGLPRAAEPPLLEPAAIEAVQRLGGHRSLVVLEWAWAIAQRLGLPANASRKESLLAATRTARDSTAPLETRIHALRLLRFGSYEDIAGPLFALLTEAEPSALQLAALEVLNGFSDVAIAPRLLEAWRNLRPPARTRAIDLLLRKRPFHGALLDAIETNRIGLGELNLDLEQRRRLLRQSAPEIQARAALIITDEEYGNRKGLVDEWLARLPDSGDAKAGRAVYEQRCATCHAFKGLGHNVGPDLAAAAHRSVEDLASNILDPNMAIAPNYVAYTAELNNGEVQTGLLLSESADAVTLIQAEGRRAVIPRRDLRTLRASGMSLMPEGLEAGMSPQDLRDLIALLQE